MNTALTTSALNGARWASLVAWKRSLSRLFEIGVFLDRYAADVRLASDNVEIIRDVAYGDHPVAHRLDIYRPRFAPRPLPILLYIHGGGFVVCSKETHASLALFNAERANYLVFNINYRLAPKHPFPAAIEDACEAYAWIAKNAESYGGDPQRIVVAGESAGGNLALGVAIAASYQRPEPYARKVYETGVRPVAVMPLMPFLQPSDPERHQVQPGVNQFVLSVVRDFAMAYLGDNCLSCAETLMADPIRVLEECGPPDRAFPRVYSATGTADLCCADTKRLEAACRTHGIDVSTHYYADEFHAFHVLRWRAAAIKFWQETVLFMQHAAVPAPAPAAQRMDVLMARLRNALQGGVLQWRLGSAHWSPWLRRTGLGTLPSALPKAG